MPKMKMENEVSYLDRMAYERPVHRDRELRWTSGSERAKHFSREVIGRAWLSEVGTDLNGHLTGAKASRGWWLKVGVPGFDKVLSQKLAGAIPRGPVKEEGVTEPEREMASHLTKHITALAAMAFAGKLVEEFEVSFLLNGPRHVVALEWFLRYQAAKRGLIVVEVEVEADGEYSSIFWLKPARLELLA